MALSKLARIATSRDTCVTRSVFTFVLLSTTMLTPVAVPFQPAFAQGAGQAQARSFAIPAQPLSSALSAFITASGWQVGYSSSIASGVTSQGVSGTMTAEQALRTLLSGTGISVRMTGANTATLVQESAGADGAMVDGAIALDTIDVSGGGSSAAATDLPYETPGSTNFISAEQINRVAPISAGDMFKSAPGVISVGNHNGTSIDVNIRGQSGMNRVKVMVDGTQQQVNSYRGYAGPDNRSYVDPDFVSGISVEKGSVAGPYGSGVTGGVVNMTTLSADDIILPGNDKGVRIKGSIGSNTTSPHYTAPPPASRPDRLPDFTSPGVANFDRPDFLTDASRTGSVVFAARSDYMEILGGYSRRVQGNYFAGTNGNRDYILQTPHAYMSPSRNAQYAADFARGAEVVNTSENTSSALAKAKIRFDDAQLLEFGFNRYESHSGVIFPSSTWMYPNTQFPLSDVLSQRYNAKYTLAPLDNRLVNLTTNIWATTFDSTDPHENNVGYRSHIESLTYGGEIWNKSLIDTGVGELRLNYGAEYAYANYDNHTLYPPRIALLYPTTPGWPLFHLNGGERTVGGAHIGASYDPTNWMTIDAGARYDFYKSSGQAYLPTLDINTFATVWENQYNDISGSAFSPKASITLRPLDGVQLFASYGRGMRPPSLIETTGSGTIARIIPNPDLKPERSEDMEIGFNILRDGVFTTNDRFKFKAAYYRNDINDYIARSFKPLYHPDYGLISADYQHQNVAKAKIRGIELNASYDAGIFFADANINYFDSVKYCFDDISSELAYGSNINGCTVFTYPGDWRGSYVQPKYAGMLTAGIRLLDEALTIGASAQFFGKSIVPPVLVASVTNPVFWDEAVIVSAFSSYKINDNLVVDLSAENLFDRFYVSPMAVAEIPSPGRTLRAGFTAKY
ncbi:TonB-dependent receptor [Hyphomicrobium sulfonivorans]|uniref:TonB-dependent receptor n=1 Tax=Hyphomicrobium sulfonivorans TaxID=121290 RepID=UPI001570F68F|nr:TonB-dependent receptor [Hyphomicrobium sulfonivorans]MBI1649579.1 TonB-dependent receptor [Hyphomicrobium sulfonivorans]NSL71495.1 hypothetical protein [Hyphomicrobium sulfonivorans]